MEWLLNLCRKADKKVYLIIDEYDNFANTILASAGKDDCEKITHGDSFFRDFFATIKKGTSTGVISRLFMSGVSPITMDDVTSGFNIGRNISVREDFNDMLGFRRDEVIRMIEYYREHGLISHDTETLMNVMGRWYDNYRFATDAETEVFNPTLVLHLMNLYINKQKIPDNLLDKNVKIEYDKLKHLILVDRKGTPKTNGNFSKLNAVIRDGFIMSKIEESFPLKHLGNTENFCSLLFYFGLLTAAGTGEAGKTKLAIPNEAVKLLFYEYIKEAYEETGIFRINLEKYSDLMVDMAYRGQWKPLLDFLFNEMAESTSLRDFVGGEKSVQAFLNVYLGLSDLFSVHSERELNKGYADLLLEPYLERFDGIKYSYLIELKYINTADRNNKALLDKKVREAKEQARQYAVDKKFLRTIRQTELIKLVAVFSGHQPLYIAEAGTA